MTRTSAVIMDYYNSEVVRMISLKYGFSPMQAYRSFADIDRCMKKE